VTNKNRGERKKVKKVFYWLCGATPALPVADGLRVLWTFASFQDFVQNLGISKEFGLVFPTIQTRIGEHLGYA
jgi:hypothetical protein